MEYNNRTYEQSNNTSRSEFSTSQFSMSPTNQYQQPPIASQNTIPYNLVMHNCFPNNPHNVSAVHPTFASSSLPKLSAVQWDDENTYCFQVEAKSITVARRKDNNMINGTKLLNVVGMTRGKRDGILKNEIGRVVVKSGSMILKGVWVTFERAIELSKEHNVYSILFPLFESNIESYYYSPMLPFSTGPPEIDISSTRWGGKVDPPTYSRKSTLDSMSDMLQRPTYPTPANSYHGRPNIDLASNPYNLQNSRSFSLDSLNSLQQRIPEYSMAQQDNSNQIPASMYYNPNPNFSGSNDTGYQNITSMATDPSFSAASSNNMYTTAPNYSLNTSQIPDQGKPLNCFYDGSINPGLEFNSQSMSNGMNPSRSFVDRNYQNSSRPTHQPSHPYRPNSNGTNSYMNTQHSNIPTTPATTPTTTTYSGRTLPDRTMSLELPPPPTRFAVMKSGGNTPTEKTSTSYSFYPIPHHV